MGRDGCRLPLLLLLRTRAATSQAAGGRGRAAGTPPLLPHARPAASGQPAALAALAAPALPCLLLLLLLDLRAERGRRRDH